MTDLDATPVQTRSGLRSSFGQRVRMVTIVVGAGLALAACGGGPGTEEEFVEILTRDGNFTDEQAGCIAEAVFDEYGVDEDALGNISAAPDLETLDGEEGVPGFSEFFTGVVAGCAPAGPTTG